MAGLFTGDIGSVGEADQGINAFGDTESPTATNLSQGFFSSFTARTVRAFRGAAQYEPGDINDGPVIADQMAAEDANKQFGIPGVLKFDKPTDTRTAKGLYDEKHAALVREDILNRSGSGAVAQFVFQSLGALADPIGLAAAIVPVFGEVQMGARLALATSAAERAALRVGAGAVEGAVGAVLLEPLNYALDQREMNDWTMGEGLRNLAFGAALGAGLHGVGGAAADGLTGRYRNPAQRAAPEDHAAALTGSVAQVVNGEPVTAAQALDIMQATRAERDLRAYAQRQTEVNDRGQVETPEGGAVDRGAALNTAQAQLAHLKAEHEALGVEIGRAREQAVRDALDPETATRLAEVERDLAGVMPRARRADLEAERTMLLEGQREPAANTSLETARSAAQAEGLAAAQGRAVERMRDVEARIEELRASDAEAAAQHEAAMRSADSTARSEAILNASKREVLQNLTERSIRQYAAAHGVALDALEVRLLAREIMSAQRAEAGDAVNLVLKDIAERNPSPLVVARGNEPVGAIVEDGSRALQNETRGAFEDIAERIRNPVEYADTVSGRRITEATEARAPKVEGDAAKQTTLADKELADLEAQIRQEHAEGRLSDSEFERIDEGNKALTEATVEDVEVFQAAASCILGNA